MGYGGLMLFLAGFYVVKAILNEKGYISDEANSVINSAIEDSVDIG